MKHSSSFFLLAVFALFIFLSDGCVKSDANKGFTSAVSGQGGSLARYAIAGNYLYMVDQQQLKTYSLADPASPQLTSTQDVGFEIETIYPIKDKLFIGSTSVIHIFSLTDPAQPVKLSTAVSPDVIRRCDPVVANDSVAYATLRTNGPCGGVQSLLVAIDIRNVEQPVQVASYPMTEPYGLAYADTALYVCDGSTGLSIFDIRVPEQLTLVNQLQTTDGQFIDLIAKDDVLICWTENGLLLYDISNRFAPQFITKID